MDSFYHDLRAISEFGRIANFHSYSSVPGDWVVALADIRGSTQAIGEGRYKDVNMAGAAAITAILNACKPLDVPFVFGGDGGTVILPGSLTAAAAGALTALQNFVREALSLDLRIGIIPVTRIRADGFDIRVRKFELSPGNYLAMISGGGLEHADDLLKSSNDLSAYMPVDIETHETPDLDGLSCRWEPLRPANDRMIALLIKENAPSGRKEVLQLSQIMEKIESILGKDAQAGAPANDHSLRFRWPPRRLRLEARMTANKANATASILLQSFYQFVCETFSVKLGSYDGAKYRDELKTNTDFRKYDDMLRLVLDVSADQLAQIETVLDKEYRNGNLVYGLHAADSALMTCLVFNLEHSQHIHFIDAANGGFARAAVDYKRRLKAAKSAV